VGAHLLLFGDRNDLVGDSGVGWTAATVVGKDVFGDILDQVRVGDCLRFDCVPSLFGLAGEGLTQGALRNFNADA